MGFQLPDDAGTVSTSKTKTDVGLDVENAERSFFERISSAPKVIKDAITGEGQDIEFPDLPETSTMGVEEGPDFWEGLLPNLKMMSARDDFAKTEIMEKSFKDDPRWGGAFVDKFGLPMIMWNKKPYYVNKPGATATDLTTALGEIVKFIPATKFANLGKTIWEVLRRGAFGYSATEGGSKVLENQLAPKVATAKTKSGEVTPKSIRDDIALSTGIGVGADLLLPPAARLTRKAISGVKSTVPPAVKSLFPRMTPEIMNTSRFPLTQGQRTSAPYDTKASGSAQTQASDAITAEDILRNSKLEGGGGETIKAFDDRQLQEIRLEAKALRDEFGSGNVGSLDSDLVPYESATGVQNIVTGEADKLKSTSSSGYEAVKEAVDQPILTAKGMNETVNRMLSTIDELQLSTRELADFPQLSREIKYLKKLQKMSANPRFKGSPFKLISGYQKTINRLMRDAATDTEKMAFGQMKSVVDDTVFNGIEQGFITGNKEIIDTLFESKEAYKKYIGLTGKAKNKDNNASNNILKMITNPDYDPSSFVNALFGHAKFNPSKEMTKILKNYKANLPQEKYDEVVDLIKDGVLEKAFAGNGKSDVTRLNIVNNYNEVFMKNKNLINELFSPSEISKIKSFRDDVMPTLWADPSLKLNAPGTAYTLLSAGRMAGIFNYMAKVPVVGTVVGAEVISKGLKRSQETGDALSAIKQYISRSNKPLLSVTGQTIVREPVVEEEVDASLSPALQSLIKTTDPSLLNQIN
jgi:hypothetical protein